MRRERSRERSLAEHIRAPTAGIVTGTGEQRLGQLSPGSETPKTGQGRKTAAEAGRL